MPSFPSLMTADEILALLPAEGRPGAMESATLEFKAMPWDTDKKAKDDVNFANDVAAMMNKDGGVIVVGLHEHQADGLSGLPGVDWSKRREQLAKWLGNHLDPRDAETYVDLPTEPVMVDGKPVFLIRVAPCPFAPIAVLDGPATHQVVHLPVRSDAVIDYLTFSEAIRAMGDSARANYVTIREICQGPAPTEVRIDHGLFVKLADSPELFPVTLAAGHALGQVREVQPQQLRVEVTQSALQNAAEAAITAACWGRIPARAQYLTMAAAARGFANRSTADNEGQFERTATTDLTEKGLELGKVASGATAKLTHLDIPLALIDAAYPWFHPEDASQTPRLGLMLRCAFVLRFEGDNEASWILTR